MLTDTQRKAAREHFKEATKLAQYVRLYTSLQAFGSYRVKAWSLRDTNAFERERMVRAIKKHPTCTSCVVVYGDSSFRPTVSIVANFSA